jgi:hypothetical protein
LNFEQIEPELDVVPNRALPDPYPPRACQLCCVALEISKNEDKTKTQNKKTNEKNLRISMGNAPAGSRTPSTVPFGQIVY